jgi:hypothetical protein
MISRSFTITKIMKKKKKNWKEKKNPFKMKFTRLECKITAGEFLVWFFTMVSKQQDKSSDIVVGIFSSSNML